MAFDLSDRRVLVTGGSSGIGAGLAEAFAAGGASIGICARRADRLAEVAERCRAHGGQVHSWTTDMADPTQVDALAADALDALGGVDLLVNNAGIPKRRQVDALDMATVDHVTRVNYLAPVQLTLAMLPHMLARGSGRIINVSSVAATLSSPGESAYSASKSALAVFSESLSVDLWDRGVRAMVVYPGVVDTELFTLPDNDPFTAEVDPIQVSDLVAAVLDALDRDALEVYVPEYFKEFAVGKANNIDGFLSGTAAYARRKDA
jgi:NAD(P)-dependent dehydrogenase (short-subunit alcohol dehydrogenase family)